jgi:hypothetical protein
MPTGNRNTVRDPPLDPTLTDVLNLLKRAVQADIRTHIPARVISYNATTQEASISIEGLTVIPDRNNLADRNAETVLPPMRLDGVPVAFEGSPTAYLTFPVVKGMTGYLEIFDRSIDTWRKSGAPSDPGLDHMHNLADCVFKPALRAKTTPLAATDLTATVLEGPLVKLGRDAAQFVALANLVDAELTKILATLNSGTVSGVPIVWGVPYVPASVTATKGMAK